MSQKTTTPNPAALAAQSSSQRTIQEMIGDFISDEFQQLVENMSHPEALAALGLQSNHTPEDLKSAYRRAVKIHHPDVGGSLEGIKRVNAAYHKLKVEPAAPQDDSLLKSVKHHDWRVRLTASQNPNLRHHHIHALLDKEMERGNQDSSASVAVFSHPNIDTNHISKGLRHWDELVREKAIRHPLSTVHHVDTAIKDVDFVVRKAAISHPEVKLRHIETALHDEDEGVRKVAIDHLRKRGVFNERF